MARASRVGGDSASPEPNAAAPALLTRAEQSFGSSGEVFGGIGWRGSTFAWGPGGTVMLRTAPGTFGLTCATLVLAVCKYAGVDLIAEETWEPRPDRDRELVLLAERFGPPGLAAQFLAEIAAGARRIRPEEMVGACCCVPLPAGFADVQPLAASVLGLLGAGAKTHASETRLERNTTHAGLTP